ncbi:glycoside hydrolase family 3 N-terminal domain-containing protein [Butyrivibrio sp. MC2021]|uniref:glycoside hydrolase family 3 N-terminal domain-containing protein n=1 Tax=Butyrivibrio sp. MC2021 TaxID=1408306 RepID=UPI00047B934E|nr:glycoside hydrolase family 3 N-terminal domain-containing protein [Butyrivibrio sp. MC2021]
MKNSKIIASMLAGAFLLTACGASDTAQTTPTEVQDTTDEATTANPGRYEGMTAKEINSVHGVNFAYGSVIFPQNINMGAAHDPELMKEYGAVVGSDLVHTGMILNFAPCVDAAQDPRWGRTYECYSDNNDLVKELSVAYTEGLLSEGVVVCPKHFFGGGYTQYGSGEYSELIERIIDRGDADMTQEEIDAQLSVYETLINTGVQVIMLSHSSLQGTKMHENIKYIDYLKKDLGFKGFILSDWDSCIMCYLPGSEGGNAVADVLSGDVPLTGTLPMPYYSSIDQIGTGECWHEAGWNAYGE